MQDKNSARKTVFYTRIAEALKEVDDRYDVVVIDCPPQLGYLTLTALTAATSVLITVHPQMLDLMSMSQFLLMLGDILKSIKAGRRGSQSWSGSAISLPVTSQRMYRRPRWLASCSRCFGERRCSRTTMVKSTAISDAGSPSRHSTKSRRANVTRSTYDRAMECMNAVNAEITALVHKAWGRK